MVIMVLTMSIQQLRGRLLLAWLIIVSSLCKSDLIISYSVLCSLFAVGAVSWFYDFFLSFSKIFLFMLS